MEKTKNFLFIYAIVIVILLLCVMFILPDSFFSKKYDDNYNKYFGGNKTQNNEPVKKEFTDYEEQKEALRSGNYSYKFNILDSMGKESYRYECTGTVDKDTETGKCVLPDLVEYDQMSKKGAYKQINIDYITPSKLFDLVKDTTPTLNSYNTYREYTYNIKIQKLETEIIVQTSLEEITQISISNAYMTYLLKFEGLKVDN